MKLFPAQEPYFGGVILGYFDSFVFINRAPLLHSFFAAALRNRANYFCKMLVNILKQWLSETLVKVEDFIHFSHSVTRKQAQSVMLCFLPPH